ncbi:uncharacterized protein TrAtP1_001349 [Trichoderma atroviride]|uniref:uncharacterized protein n=1 Tax=Hypocrea atroviridis TaxID=63577 RepID=UPI0033252878|nr:hypothetical protein TrAtP1_001349 [Trichoderma atroviride]
MISNRGCRLDLVDVTVSKRKKKKKKKNAAMFNQGPQHPAEAIISRVEVWYKLHVALIIPYHRRAVNSGSPQKQPQKMDSKIPVFVETLKKYLFLAFVRLPLLDFHLRPSSPFVQGSSRQLQ